MSIAEVLMFNAALVALAMVVLWLLSLRLKDAGIVDIFWGLGFVLVSWSTFAVVPTGLRGVILTVLTTVWGVRLAGYIGRRNHGKGEDSRYKAMRDYRGNSFWWFSLISVFALQGVVMWLISLPVQIGQVAEASMGILNFAGVGIWLIGFLFESVGDYQLAKFKSIPDSRGKVMDRGLWRFTRHPNYFGNAMIWWGLFFVAATWSTVWLVISPIFMTFLLVKVSGVALLERNLAGRSEEYRDYIQRTSAFIPWPPKT